MENAYTFVVNRQSDIESAEFTCTDIKQIDVGMEGFKFLANISTPRGKNLGRAFIKNAETTEEQAEQVAKHSFFKANGVNVTCQYKPIILNGKHYYCLMEDLTENGNYFVLGPNNFDISRDWILESLSSLEQEILIRIQSSMIQACEVASGIYNDHPNVYEFQSNAFLIKFNPNELSKTEVLLADIGMDVKVEEKLSKDPTQTLIENLKSAAHFYSYMTNQPFTNFILVITS